MGRGDLGRVPMRQGLFVNTDSGLEHSGDKKLMEGPVSASLSKPGYGGGK